jgi:hypothetical protein
MIYWQLTRQQRVGEYAFWWMAHGPANGMYNECMPECIQCTQMPRLVSADAKHGPQ